MILWSFGKLKSLLKKRWKWNNKNRTWQQRTKKENSSMQSRCKILYMYWKHWSPITNWNPLRHSRTAFYQREIKCIYLNFLGQQQIQKINERINKFRYYLAYITVICGFGILLCFGMMRFILHKKAWNIFST